METEEQAIETREGVLSRAPAAPPLTAGFAFMWSRATLARLRGPRASRKDSLAGHPRALLGGGGVDAPRGGPSLGSPASAQPPWDFVIKA